MSTRGLNLQSEKTKILLKKNARDDFEGASQVLRAVTAQLKSELVTEAALDPYATSEDIFAALGAMHIFTQKRVSVAWSDGDVVRA